MVVRECIEQPQPSCFTYAFESASLESMSQVLLEWLEASMLQWYFCFCPPWIWGVYSHVRDAWLVTWVLDLNVEDYTIVFSH